MSETHNSVNPTTHKFIYIFGSYLNIQVGYLTLY